MVVFGDSISFGEHRVGSNGLELARDGQWFSDFLVGSITLGLPLFTTFAATRCELPFIFSTLDYTGSSMRGTGVNRDVDSGGSASTSALSVAFGDSGAMRVSQFSTGTSERVSANVPYSLGSLVGATTLLAPQDGVTGSPCLTFLGFSSSFQVALPLSVALLVWSTVAHTSGASSFSSLLLRSVVS